MATSKASTTRSTKTTPTKKSPRSSSTARKPQASATRANEIPPEIRHQMIAEAAYLRAERRGFSAGDPLEDWLIAESEVDMLLAERATQPTQ